MRSHQKESPDFIVFGKKKNRPYTFYTMAIFNFSRQRAFYTLPTRSGLAKLFFIAALRALVHGEPLISAAKPVLLIETRGTVDKKRVALNSGQESYLCVFFSRNEWYLVWHGDEGKFPPAFDIPKDLPIGMSDLERASAIKTSRACVALKFKVCPTMAPVVERCPEGWIVYPAPLSRKKPDNFNRLGFDLAENGNFRILATNRVIPVTLEFPDATEIEALLTPVADGGLKANQIGYANVLETTQGISMVRLSDLLVMEPAKDSLNFSVAEKPPIEFDFHEKHANMAAPTGTFFGGDSNEPPPGEKYRADSALLKLRKAWLEIIYGEGLSAKNTLNLLLAEHPGVAGDYCFLSLKGSALCLNGDYAKSAEILKSLPKTAEIGLWLNIALSRLGEKVTFDQSAIAVLASYPQTLSDVLASLVIPYLFETGQFDALRTIMVKIPPRFGQAKAIGEFYLAKQTFVNENANRGYRLLLDLAREGYELSLPTELSVEARFLTATFRNDLKPSKNFDEYLWVELTQARGTATELKIASRLLEELEKTKDFAKAIDLSLDLARRFPEAELCFGFSKRLKAYLLKFFLGNDDKISQVKYAALFKTHRQELEKLKEFEAIALKTAEKLTQLDLIEQAADLVLTLSERTTDALEKRAYLLRATKLYLKADKNDRAIALLKDAYAGATDSLKAEMAPLLAKAYLGKKDHATAIAYLKEFPSSENEKTLADIYMSLKNYPELAKSLRACLEFFKAGGDDGEREKTILRLAATYRILNDREGLEKLAKTATKFMRDKRSYKAFAAFCRPPASKLKTTRDVMAYMDDGKALIDIVAAAGKTPFGETLPAKG